MIEIRPTGCEGCTIIKPRMDGDVKVYDYCPAFACTITDEMNGACRYWCGVLDA